MELQENSAEPRRLEDLKPGMELKGKVAKIGLYGAVVDVGLERDGLLHISQLKRGMLNHVEDVIQPGQTINAWVHRIDYQVGRLELTLIKPLTLPWRKIKPGMQVTGKVLRVENFGVFVDIGAERPGLVHVSEMSNEYVSDPGELVSEGDEVRVSIIDFDRKKHQISLSMKATELETEAVESQEEEIPTAMEIALKQAMRNAKAQKVPSGQSDLSDPSSRYRNALDDILQRTLEQRVRTSSQLE